MAGQTIPTMRTRPWRTKEHGHTLGVERMSENVYIVLGSVDNVSVFGFLDRELSLNEKGSLGNKAHKRNSIIRIAHEDRKKLANTIGFS